MISKKKIVTTSLITALIMTLVFANLNVTSTGAAGTTTTFNSDITMDFGSDKSTFFTNGTIMKFKNDTADITEIRPGLWFEAFEDLSLAFSAPEEGAWYYVYAPAHLYGAYIAFQVDTVVSTGVAHYYYFNVSLTWEHYYDWAKNFTIFPPVEAGGYIKTERMIDPLITDYDYFVLSGVDVPTDDSWWKIDYPSDWAGSQFHVNVTTYSIPFDYWEATIDTLLNTTKDSVTSIPADPKPNEGFGGFELIKTVEPGTEYYIFSPTTLLPEPGSWWNITYPTEVAGWQFNVSSSSEGNHFVIDTLLNTTGQPQNIILTDPDSYVSAVLETAPAPKVGRIEACEWFNVIAGATPDPGSWYKITASDPVDTSLVGVQFYVDMGGESVFHIDEVFNTTAGQHQNITVSPAVDSVTAEELTPALYVDPVSYVNEALGLGDNFTVAIKTNYTMNIWGYEFTLAYNPLVLNVTNLADITNGDLISNGHTFLRGGVDYAAGEVKLTGAKFDDPTIMNYSYPGPGTLAYVNFTVVGEGDSFITLGSRVIKITNGGLGEEQNVVDDATGLIVNGYFRSSPPVTHDISLMDVDIVLPYGLVVLQNASLYPTWNVTVEIDVYNKGTNETYDVKVYYDFIAANWLLDAQTVVDHANLTHWYPNLTSIATDVFPGNRTLKVKATLAYGIEDEVPADNVWTDIEVQVRIPGDIDGNEVVDKFDFWDFAEAFGAEPGDTTPPGVWNPWADYGEEQPLDGTIDRYDFSILADNFGKNLTTIRD